MWSTTLSRLRRREAQGRELTARVQPEGAVGHLNVDDDGTCSFRILQARILASEDLSEEGRELTDEESVRILGTFVDDLLGHK